MKIEKNILVVDITKPRYERRGECSRCGDCCIGENCEYLILKDEKVVCAIHENRPEKCSEYPANPPIVFKGCSYTFWDKWEKRIVKAGEV